MGYDDEGPAWTDFYALESLVEDLQASIRGLQLRLGDAENRLEALDPGAASVDSRASQGPPAGTEDMTPVGKALWEQFGGAP